VYVKSLEIDLLVVHRAAHGTPRTAARSCIHVRAFEARPRAALGQP